MFTVEGEHLLGAVTLARDGILRHATFDGREIIRRERNFKGLQRLRQLIAAARTEEEYQRACAVVGEARDRAVGGHVGEGEYVRPYDGARGLAGS